MNLYNPQWHWLSDNVIRMLWKNTTKLGAGAYFRYCKMWSIVQYEEEVDRFDLTGNVLPPNMKLLLQDNNLLKLTFILKY